MRPISQCSLWKAVTAVCCCVPKFLLRRRHRTWGFWSLGLARGIVGQGGPMKTEVMKEPSRTREPCETGGGKVGMVIRGGVSRNEAELKGTSERPEAGKDPQSPAPQPAAGESAEPEGGGARGGESEPPHGSAAGSNGFILGEQHQGPPLCRTSGSPANPSLVGHASKALPSPATSRARHPGPGAGVGLGAGAAGGSRTETEAKNGTTQAP
ncbi:hypothetical protein AAFF_G00064490 [Aldrovandia affinis]|uniref:Uncharacterized protein n=1 Tax=Aldrovandia affinis TaxID=143900 RepID=A0AAD7T3U5_9TELE|nr:hypothetical protein AAFF_G00064490 [Aldrovandia affinis]